MSEDEAITMGRQGGQGRFMRSRYVPLAIPDAEVRRRSSIGLAEDPGNPNRDRRAARAQRAAVNECR